MKDKAGSSRQRLQEAAKALFAERGYEHTTVAAIVKLAKTSYSQFIVHFGDKSGVLSAIFLQAWGEIISTIRLATSRTSSPVGKLNLIVDVLLSYLERDQAFRTLLLMERATTRDGNTVLPNAGLSDFMKILDEVFEDMVRTGELSRGVPPQLLRSALVGALEGMLRDQFFRAQTASGIPYSESAVRAVFGTFLESFLQPTQRAEVQDEFPEGAVDIEIDRDWIHHYLRLAAVALERPGNA